MRKLTSFFLLVIAGVSHANQLHNYDEIKSAVTTGKAIKIVILDNCVLEIHNRAGFGFSKNKATDDNFVFEYMPNKIKTLNGKLTSSYFEFTYDPSGPSYEYVQFSISKDNNLRLDLQLLDARNYESKYQQFVNCKLDLGFKVYAQESG